MSDRLVSVVITTYKRDAKILIRAIESVINQTYSKIQIIVVDDNINDSQYSEEVIKILKEYPEITYIKQDGNKGACMARNLGIERSEGELMAFLDDDDVWDHEKIAKQSTAFQKFEDAGIIYCTGYIKFEDHPEKGLIDYYTKKFFLEKVTFEDMLAGDHIGTTTNPLIARKCFVECGGFKEGLPARQDYEMWLRISKKFNVYGMDDQLFIHYMHSGEQISKNHKKALIGYKYIYNLYNREYKKNAVALINIMNWICEESEAINKFTAILPKVQRKYFTFLIKVGVIG